MDGEEGIGDGITTSAESFRRGSDSTDIAISTRFSSKCRCTLSSSYFKRGFLGIIFSKIKKI
jgi:hypothetical protein